MSPRTLPIELVQAAVAFARHHGWDIDRMLAEVGVSPMLLTERRARVTEDQLVSLAQRLWRDTDDELLGLSSHPLPRGSFRLLTYGLIGATDLGEALRRLQGFLRALPAMPVEIEIGPETTKIGLGVSPSPTDDPEHLMPLVGLAAAHRLIAWLVKQHVRLQRVEFGFAEPESRAGFDALFDDPLVFSAPSSGIVIDSALLRSPILRTEREVDEFVEHSPQGLLLLPRYTTSMTERVRRMIEAGPRTGRWPGAEDIARRLAMSQETVRRKLAEEGTSVRQLIEDVRRDTAVESLVRGTESVADLATRLGFSEPSAFTRAFRRWTGSTPGAYRRDGDRPGCTVSE